MLGVTSDTVRDQCFPDGNSTGGGGGGSGNRIQLAELPEASLEYKDRIVQYIGATTETLTNGYFYKCVEHTTTEGDTITVTYSWDNIPVMKTSGGYELVSSVTCDGVKTYKALFVELMTNVVISSDKTYLLKMVGSSPLYHETSRPTSGNSLGFYQTYNTGSTIFTDNIMLSNTPSEVVFLQGDSDVSELAPAEGRIFKLFSISVDSAI